MSKLRGTPAVVMIPGTGKGLRPLAIGNMEGGLYLDICAAP